MPALLVAAPLVIVAISFLLISFWDAPVHSETVNAVQTVLLLLLFSALVTNVRGDWLNPLIVMIGMYIMFFFYGAYYGIAYQGLGRDPFLIQSLLLAIIGFVAFWAGYSLSFSDGWVRKLPPFSAPIDSKRLLVIILAGTALAAVLFLVYFQVVGGLGNYLADVNRTRFVAARGNYYILWGIMFPIEASIMWYANTASRGTNRSVISAIVMLVLIIISTALVAPLGARIYLVHLFSSLLVCRNYLVKKVRLIPIGLALAVMLVGFVAYQLYRFSTAGYLRVEDIPILLSNPETFLHFSASEFLLLDDLAFVVRTWPTHDGYLTGRSYLWPFIAYIPRAIWHGKPIAMSVGYSVNVHRIGTWQASQTGGMGVTAIGEGYANFGLIGVVINMLLLGLVSRLMYRYVSSNQNNPVIVPIYAAFLFSLFLGFQAEVSLAIPYFLQYIIPLIVMYKIASRP